MLLQQLKLQNIRSYVDETIGFPEGSILLAGDIGSGKSTILLAIEFALFGASKTDLPAESLLRKGATQASVECSFILGDKEITIKRGLKKERDSIKQTAGHVIINKVKRELMPIELKAEMISLLGYPEELLTKNKNYIFRYTVYTPQEEMKLILQEEAEVRQDTLRKIFNIDKYKVIRENTQHYLKTLRDKIRFNEAAVRPLEQTKLQLQQAEGKIALLQESLQSLEPSLMGLQQQLQQQQKMLDGLEQQQRQFQQQSQEVTTLKVLLQEKKAQLKILQERQQALQERLSAMSIPPEITLENLQQEKKQLEWQKQQLLTSHSVLQEKTASLERLIRQLQSEISVLQQKTLPLLAKQLQQQKLIQEFPDRKQLEDQRTQLEELFTQSMSFIARNEKVLADAQEVVQKIGTIQSCPTCLQEITPEHRDHILAQEEEKRGKAENQIIENNKKKSVILQQRQQLHADFEELTLKDNLRIKLELEIQHLLIQQQELLQKRQQMAERQQEHHKIKQELQRIMQESHLPKLDEKLNILQQQLTSLIQQQELQRRWQELQQQSTELKLQCLKLGEQVRQLQQKMEVMKDPTAELQQQKALLNKAQQQERSLAVEQGQLQMQLQHSQQEKQRLQTIMLQLREEAATLIRLKELHHWLEEYFVNLTYTIEKHVMTNIYYLFNSLFQEWFSILIDDETITARLDDSFTPVIEQNGYDVSFTTLSGGEKTSAALAYRLALNRVINDVIHEIKTKDLLILDEPTDGFSSEQLDKVRDVLDRLQLRQTIIVSHEAKIETFVENVIRVQKEGHVSRIG